MQRPHGVAYQQARTRDGRTGQPATGRGRDVREGRLGEGRRREAAPAPPSGPAVTARTHQQGTAPAKAVVTHSATHQHRG